MGTAYAMGAGEPTPPPESNESVLRVWLEPPDRVRCETTRDVEGRSLTDLLIVDGPTWWSDSLEFGAMTNNGNPRHQHGLPLAPEMLEPLCAVTGRNVDVGPAIRVAGREGIRVATTARLPSRAIFHDVHMFGFRADTQQLVIDAERGIVLRTTSFLDGEPYNVTEFTEIEFDEPIDAGLFVFESATGTEPVDARTFQSPPAPLFSVSADAPFTVFASLDLPDGWNLSCFLREANDRAGWPAAVDLHYSTRDAGASVSVTETAVTDRPPERTPDGRPWETITRDDVAYRAWEPAGEDWPMARQIVFERDGTEIRLMSAELGRDELVSFAGTFRPASTEPPSIG